MIVKLTDTLLGEHGAFRMLFSTIEKLANTSGDLAQIEGALAALTAEIRTHATFEEEILFPALLPFLEGDELIAEIQAEHHEIRDGLKQIENAQHIEHAVNAVRLTFAVTRQHFEKEEQVLYPLARQLLHEEALSGPGDAWAEARRMTIG
jgi:hypothetical protein